MTDKIEIVGIIDKELCQIKLIKTLKIVFPVFSEALNCLKGLTTVRKKCQTKLFIKFFDFRNKGTRLRITIFKEFIFKLKFE